MSFLEELEGQLKSTEARIAKLVQDIEQTHSLEQSFERARDGFDQASTNLGDLAKTIEASAKSLQETADMLRVAVSVLERSDPDRIHNEIKELKSLSERSSQEHLGSAGHMFEALVDLKNSAEFSAREQSNSGKRQRWLLYLLLGLVVILVGIDLLPFMPEHFSELITGGALD